jgi:hypothetical protein
VTNQNFDEWYTEFISPRGFLLETRGIKSYLKQAWDAGASSQQVEPTEDARSIGHSMRQCLLRKQQIPDALALSALTYLDPPTEESVGPWCDNCGQDEDAHVGPELKCPPENRS